VAPSLQVAHGAAKYAVQLLSGVHEKKWPEIELHDVQKEFRNSTALWRGFVGGRGGGKALALTTPLPTPNGWTTMGEVQSGDVVFDEQGQPCNVVAATPVQFDRPCYRVTFSDGTTVIADAEHEWLTDTRVSRKALGRVGAKRGIGHTGVDRSHLPQCQRRHFPKVVTTIQIAATLLHGDRERNHSIEPCNPLQCDDVLLPIAPYTLGAWLGDGTATTTRITSADIEIIENIRDDGYIVERKQPRGKAYSYAVFAPGERRRRDPASGQYRAFDGHLAHELRKLGVLGRGKKHIPQIYLRAAEWQRWALLQGLMDTDGYVDVRGKCEFCTVDYWLARDVYELCMSLGFKAGLKAGKAWLYGKDCGTRYRIGFTPYVPVFRLQRKLDRQKKPGKQWRRQLRRYITAVEPVPSVPVRCIQVDSPSHLYLATESMIPTHNSFCGAVDMIERAKASRLYMVVAPTYPLLRDTSFRSFIEVATKLNCIVKTNKGDFFVIIRTKDGGEAQVNFRSAHDPETLRGPNLSGCWMDEASLMKEEAFDIVIASLREASEMGFLGLTFTPKGKGHWTYSLFHDKEGNPKPNTELFRATSKQNPFLPDNFYEVMASKYVEGSTLARQELLGEFVDLSGLLFQRFWYDLVQTVPAVGTRVRYWDKAGTHDSGDWTCGVLMARDELGVFFVEDVVRGQWSPFERNKKIRETAARDAKRFHNQVTIFVEQEPGSGGKESALLTLQELAQYPVYIDRVTGDKVTRARPLQAQSEAGNVKVAETEWTEEWFDELTSFPEAKHDDQVDATSGAYNKLAAMTGIDTSAPLIVYPEAPSPENAEKTRRTSESPPKPVETDLSKWLQQYAGVEPDTTVAPSAEPVAAGSSGNRQAATASRLAAMWGDDWDD